MCVCLHSQEKAFWGSKVQLKIINTECYGLIPGFNYFPSTSERMTYGSGVVYYFTLHDRYNKIANIENRQQINYVSEAKLSDASYIITCGMRSIYNFGHLTNGSGREYQFNLPVDPEIAIYHYNK